MLAACPCRSKRSGCWRSSAGVWAAACAGKSPSTSGTRAPPPEDAREFYPLETGWKWAYEIDKGGEQILAVYAVVGRQGATATLQAGEERIVYTVLPEGIARRAPGPDSPRRRFSPAQPAAGRGAVADRRRDRHRVGGRQAGGRARGQLPRLHRRRGEPDRSAAPGAHDLRARRRAGGHRVPGSRPGQRAVPDGAAREPARCDTTRKRPTGRDRPSFRPVGWRQPPRDVSSLRRRAQMVQVFGVRSVTLSLTW